MSLNKFPAAEAYEKEQAVRMSTDPLDTGLQDSFPASDPVSATATPETIRSGQNEAASDAPRVDEAIGSILDHRNDPYAEPREQAAALRDEFESLRYRATEQVKSKIRQQPWQAIGLAAAIGFVIGLTR